MGTLSKEPAQTPSKQKRVRFVKSSSSPDGLQGNTFQSRWLERNEFTKSRVSRGFVTSVYEPSRRHVGHVVGEAIAEEMPADFSDSEGDGADERPGHRRSYLHRRMLWGEEEMPADFTDSRHGEGAAASNALYDLKHLGLEVRERECDRRESMLAEQLKMMYSANPSEKQKMSISAWDSTVESLGYVL